MKTLQELIGLAEAKNADHAADDHAEKVRERASKMDMDEVVDAWMDHHSYHSFEGRRGVERLGDLVADIGYGGLDEFFGDNSGLGEAFVDFAKEHQLPMRDGGTADDELDEWLNDNNVHRFEGDRGVANLEKIATRALGYDDLDHALGDNPGFLEQCVEWVKQHGDNSDWRTELVGNMLGDGWEPDVDPDEDGDEDDAPAAKGDDAAHLKGKGPVEVADVLKFFPKSAQKVLRVLGGQERLTLGGKPVGGKGSVTEAFTAAVKHYLTDGHEADVSFDMEIPASLSENGDDETIQVEYQQPFDARDVEDIRLEDMRYDPRTGQVFGVFDVFLAEDAMNEAFDEEFEKATGVSHDYDNPEHQAVYQKVWKNWTDNGLSGMSYVFSFDPETGEVDEQPHLTTGGFAHGHGGRDGGIANLQKAHPAALELPRW